MQRPTYCKRISKEVYHFAPQMPLSAQLLRPESSLSKLGWSALDFTLYLLGLVLTLWALFSVAAVLLCTATDWPSSPHEWGRISYILCPTLPQFDLLFDFSASDGWVILLISASSMKGVLVGLRRSLKCSLHSPTMSSFEVSSPPSPLYTVWTGSCFLFPSHVAICQNHHEVIIY